MLGLQVCTNLQIFSKWLSGGSYQLSHMRFFDSQENSLFPHEGSISGNSGMEGIFFTK